MAVTMRSQKQNFDHHAVRTENQMAERKFKIGDNQQNKFAESRGAQQREYHAHQHVEQKAKKQAIQNLFQH
jgi:hypothetical protein